MDKLLKLLEEDATLSNEELAVMVGLSPAEVAERLDRYRKDGVLLGYHALVNWERAGEENVESMIELKVSPKRGYGFDEIASAIAEMPEVESVHLMSGGYDLLLTVRGSSFKDVAMFVARRLSTMESVLSTATHFVLRTYKEKGHLTAEQKKDPRAFGGN